MAAFHFFYRVGFIRFNDLDVQSTKISYNQGVWETSVAVIFLVICWNYSGVCTDINTMILLWYSCDYISGDESNKPTLSRGYMVWFSPESSNVPHWNSPNIKLGAILLQVIRQRKYTLPKMHYKFFTYFSSCLENSLIKRNQQTDFNIS